MGLGIYFFFAQEHKQRDDLTAFGLWLIGFTYITVNSYVKAFPLFQEWKSTSMLAAPYAYAILYLIFRSCSTLKLSRLSSLGRASYHIYLVQMAYYIFVRPAMNHHRTLFEPPVFHLLNVATAVTFCLSVGYLFYLLEGAIRPYLIRGFLRITSGLSSDARA